MAKSTRTQKSTVGLHHQAPRQGRPAKSAYYARAIFIAALFGMLISVHYWIQADRGFDRGCLGFATETVEVAGECVAVANSDAASPFGVSNAIWGFIFYLTVGALCIAGTVLRPSFATLSRRIRQGLVAVGLVYTIYLVLYQAFYLQEFCPLCLLSSLTVSVLFVLHILEFKALAGSGNKKPDFEGFSWYGFATFIGGGVILGVLIFVDGVGTSPGAPNEIRRIAPETTPEIVDHQHLNQIASCGFDEATPLADIDTFVDADDEYIGDSAAPVRIIEFFDPNCPHCKVLHSVMGNLDIIGASKAKLFLRPFPLWPFSTRQVQAIYLARDQGKSHEMIGSQFEHQKQGGLSEPELMGIAKAIGLDIEAFRTGYRAGRHLDEIQNLNRLRSEAGISSAPRLTIEGKFVASTNQSLTVECISRLIDQEYDKMAE